MPKIKTADGVSLYYEEAGAGTPVVFVHEFAGDYRTWEPQMRHFARSHRCVTYSQRGYPPSDVPDDPASYGQDIARGDVIARHGCARHRQGACGRPLDGRLHALHVGMRHPERCISVTAAGCGWGSLPDPAARAAMRAQAAETAKMFTEKGMPEAAAIYADGADAAGAEVQGSARLRGIRAHARRTFGARPRADHGDAAKQAPDAVGLGSGLEEILGAASRSSAATRTRPASTAASFSSARRRPRRSWSFRAPVTPSPARSPPPSTPRSRSCSPPPKPAAGSRTSRRREA